MDVEVQAFVFMFPMGDNTEARAINNAVLLLFGFINL